jgi:drug/metabolite transporter (DMT)-like permease
MTGRLPRWLPAYLILAAIWGCSFLFIEVGLESFSPAGVAFGRITMGLITVVLLSVVTRAPLPPRWAWGPLFIASLLWVSVPWLLFAVAQTMVTSSLAGIMNAATPLMTLLAILIAFPEERPTPQQIIGLAIGFLGILVVIGVGNIGNGSSSLLGVGLLLIAVACYGVAFPFARRFLTGPTARATLHPLSLAMGLLIGGFIVTAPITAIIGLTTYPPTSPSVLAVVALGVLGSGIAYALNFFVTQNADATTASTVTYLTPVVAVIVGAIVLSEPLAWHQGVGAVFVILGAATAQGLIRPGSKRLRTGPPRDPSSSLGSPS